METLAYFFLASALLSTLALILGLTKPLLVGWFWAKCNRRKVLYRYGLMALISWLAYLATELLIGK